MPCARLKVEHWLLECVPCAVSSTKVIQCIGHGNAAPNGWCKRRYIFHISYISSATQCWRICMRRVIQSTHARLTTVLTTVLISNLRTHGFLPLKLRGVSKTNATSDHQNNRRFQYRFNVESGKTRRGASGLSRLTAATTCVCLAWARHQKAASRAAL